MEQRKAKRPVGSGPQAGKDANMRESARILALPSHESTRKFSPAEALGQRIRDIRIVVLGAIDDAELHGDYSGVNRRMYGIVELIEEALELHAKALDSRQEVGQASRLSMKGEAA